jgi:uncharacterized protein YjaZ
MTLRLTPQNIEDAYNYLKNTAPFNKWKLPDSDDIGFKVTKQADRYGHYNDGKPQGHWPHIAVSVVHTRDTPMLLAVIAHELCHIRLGQLGKSCADHGRLFKQLAKRVCAAHGFDIKTF